MQGLEGLFSEPNGPAYTRREERVGPPLDFVAEKSRSALEELQELYSILLRTPTADVSGIAFSELIARVRAAAYYMIVSHLALNNMLGHMRDPATAEAVLTCSPEEFRSWLDLIDREGSVCG